MTRDTFKAKGVSVEVLAQRIEAYHWDIADKTVAAQFAAELRALAQQTTADGGFTAADMMDARQEGRKEAEARAERLTGALKRARESIEEWAYFANSCGGEITGLQEELLEIDLTLRDHGQEKGIG